MRYNLARRRNKVKLQLIAVCMADMATQLLQLRSLTNQQTAVRQ